MLGRSTGADFAGSVAVRVKLSVRGSLQGAGEGGQGEAHGVLEGGHGWGSAEEVWRELGVIQRGGSQGVGLVMLMLMQVSSCV